MSRLRRTKRQRRKKRDAEPKPPRARLTFAGRAKSGELGEPQLVFFDEDTGKEIRTRDYGQRPRAGQWGKSSPNPQLRIGPPPFDGIDETRCRVCGERIEQWRAGITWEDGTQAIRDAAENQGIEGGGYRTRGPVLYAMHYLKLKAWWDRHSFGGCRQLWDEWNERVPFPKPVVWGCFYGRPSDCAPFELIEALHTAGIYRPANWPPPLLAMVQALALDVGQNPDLDRLEKGPPWPEEDPPNWTDPETWTYARSVVAQLVAPDTSQDDPENVIPF